MLKVYSATYHVHNVKDQKILNSILNLTTLLPKKVRYESPKDEHKNVYLGLTQSKRDL